jgi:hypothetical protein
MKQPIPRYFIYPRNQRTRPSVFSTSHPVPNRKYSPLPTRAAGAVTQALAATNNKSSAGKRPSFFLKDQVAKQAKLRKQWKNGKNPAPAACHALAMIPRKKSRPYD